VSVVEGENERKQKKRHPRTVSVFLRVLTVESPEDVFLKILMLTLKEISVGALKDIIIPE
jgi:hypothetical protein